MVFLPGRDVYHDRIVRRALRYQEGRDGVTWNICDTSLVTSVTKLRPSVSRSRSVARIVTSVDCRGIAELSCRESLSSDCHRCFQIPSFSLPEPCRTMATEQRKRECGLVHAVVGRSNPRNSAPVHRKLCGRRHCRSLRNTDFLPAR